MGEDGVPDFRVEFGQLRIAAELAKFAIQDVEHARGASTEWVQPNAVAFQSV